MKATAIPRALLALKPLPRSVLARVALAARLTP